MKKMINEHFEGAKISFMDRKESDFERKVWKLQQEMMNLDNRLKNEKLILKRKLSRDESELLTFSQSSQSNSSFSLGMGDVPDLWHTLPVQVHQNKKTYNIQPTIFFTWDLTPFDFQNYNAQRSIFTLLDHWNPKDSISAERFRKQLSALLTANCKTLPSMFENHSKNYQSNHNPDDTRGMFYSFEKKFKDVESKCTENFFNSIAMEEVNKVDKQEEILFDDNTTDLDKQVIINDDLIFDIFNEPCEEYCRKPMGIEDIKKEVDTLIKSINLLDKPQLQNIDSMK